MSQAIDKSLIVLDSDESELPGIMDTLYNLVDLSETELSEDDLEVDYALQYLKDLVVVCPN